MNLKPYLISLLYSLFWIYGTFTLMTLLFSLLMPQSAATSITGFVSGAFGSLPWYFILLNNFLVFIVFQFSPYNISSILTGAVAGSILASQNLRGSVALTFTYNLLSMPFVFFEFGAFVFSVSVSFYAQRYKHQKFFWRYYTPKKYLLILTTGLLLLTIGAILEVGL